jgi:thiamine kinase-like enzyme
MVASLPGNIRLRLERTLAQWRHWDCEPVLPAPPGTLALLGAGLSNVSVLVEAGRRFVVRIDGIDPAAHSLSRQGEWHSLGAASLAGLAPQPRYFNPELGSLVCDYLEPDPRQPLLIADIAQLLRRIHQLPPRHQRLDLPERLLGYEKRLAQRTPARAQHLGCYQTAVRAKLASALEVRCQAVHCHHDLLRANRLYSGGRLFALDWEYSAMGNPWYDLAVVMAGDSLSAQDADLLLETYLGRPAEAAERRLVTSFGCVYRYLEVMWYLVQGHPALDDASLQQKLQCLEEQLASP